MVDASPVTPSAAVMGTYNRFPIALLRGKGCWVWDDQSRRHLDAVAGMPPAPWATATGQSAKPDRSVAQAPARLQPYQIPEQEQLAAWLVNNSCADSVFFCNSGAEANEAAIKLARKHGHQKRGIERPVIITAAASFHGRTLAAVSATGQPRYHQGFEPMVEGFEFFTYNDLADFEQLLERLEQDGPRVAAVLIEPLQGEGGVNPGDPAVMKAIRRHCDARDILLIFDEVQVGMGRTGTLWGYEQLGVVPDALTLAKGLGGGHAVEHRWCGAMPMCSNPVTTRAPLEAIHSACRAGLTVASEIERRNLLRNVRERGDQLRAGLNRLVERYPDQLEEPWLGPSAGTRAERRLRHPGH